MGTCTSKTTGINNNNNNSHHAIQKGHSTRLTEPTNSRRRVVHNLNQNDTTPTKSTTVVTATPQQQHIHHQPLLYDSLIRTHHHRNPHPQSASSSSSSQYGSSNNNNNNNNKSNNNNNNTDPTTTATATTTTTIDQYYDKIECIGRGSFSTVYKIQKKPHKIGGSSRPANTTVMMKKSSSMIETTSLHNSTTACSSNDNNNMVSPLWGPKTTYQRQRSLHHIRSDNCESGPTTWTTNTPQLYFVLKDLNLPTSAAAATLEQQQQQQQQQEYQLFSNEIQILKTLDHPNIIKIYETFCSPTQLQVVMEYCGGGDLISYLSTDHHQHQDDDSVESRMRHLMQQMLAATGYLHHDHRHILHRDIKLENFVLEQRTRCDDNDNDGRPVLKMIDFGVSVVRTNHDDDDDYLTERIGTLYTMSPETILQRYSFPADVWSLGVCLYMLLSGGTAPFAAPTNKETVQRILAGRYHMASSSSIANNNSEEPNRTNNVWAQRSEASQDLIRHLLVVNPSERYTIRQAQQHPWITGRDTTPTTTPTMHHHHHHPPAILDDDTRRLVRDTMIRYAFSTGDFMKLASHVLAKQALTQDIDDLRAIFEVLNTDRTGTISYEQFRTVLFPPEEMEETPYTDAYIEELFHKLDVNKNHVITYTEFIAAVLEMHGKIEEYRFAEAFDQLDCDDSGFISKENIQELLGDNVDEAYIDKLIAEADYLNDGRISYGEFKQAFRDQMRNLVSSIKSRSSLSGMFSDSERSELEMVYSQSQ